MRKKREVGIGVSHSLFSFEIRDLFGSLVAVWRHCCVWSSVLIGKSCVLHG